MSGGVGDLSENARSQGRRRASVHGRIHSGFRTGLPHRRGYHQSETAEGILKLKDSLKPMTYSQVNGFQEEGLFARRKVPQLLHWSGAINLACQPIFTPQAGQARRNCKIIMGVTKATSKSPKGPHSSPLESPS